MGRKNLYSLVMWQMCTVWLVLDVRLARGSLAREPRAGEPGNLEAVSLVSCRVAVRPRTAQAEAVRLFPRVGNEATRSAVGNDTGAKIAIGAALLG